MSRMSNSESSLPTTTTQAVHFPSSPPMPLESEPTSGDLLNPNSDPPVKLEMEHAPLPRRERESSAETERPPSAQQRRKEEDATSANERGMEEANDGGNANDEDDPAEELAHLAWEDLEARYHQAMESCHKNEEELLVEFAKLMKFFQAWAGMGHKQETSRTFSRLRTRMAHVQHSEEQLEKTRDHYVKVVHAFESALNLLRNMSG